MAVPRYSTRELTKHLRELAAEAETLSDTGEVVTKAEALARALWKKALGYQEMRKSEGGLKEIDHPPEAWAIQLIYERLEGKVPNATPEDGGRMSAADRVSDLSKARINDLATAAVAGAGGRIPMPKPPKLPPKKGPNG